MAVGERLSPELRQLSKILTATEHSQQVEYGLFCMLRRWVADRGDRLRRVADLLASIDALASLAAVAAGSSWQRLRSRKHLACRSPRAHLAVEVGSVLRTKRPGS